MQELLDLYLEVLPAYYPDLYTVQGEGDDRVITISFPDGNKRVYAVKDFADCPIELCGRIVQVWAQCTMSAHHARIFYVLPTYTMKQWSLLCPADRLFISAVLAQCTDGELTEKVKPASEQS